MRDPADGQATDWADVGAHEAEPTSAVDDESTAAERLRFELTDTHVVYELRRAEGLLRDGTSPLVRDRETATLLADVFKRWAFVGGLDPDLLNRIGGPETVLLARHILRWNQP